MNLIDNYILKGTLGEYTTKMFTNDHKKYTKKVKYILGLNHSP